MVSVHCGVDDHIGEFGLGQSRFPSFELLVGRDIMETGDLGATFEVWLGDGDNGSGGVILGENFGEHGPARTSAKEEEGEVRLHRVSQSLSIVSHFIEEGIAEHCGLLRFDAD